MQNSAFLKGEKIFLRSLEAEDAENFWRWSCDREVVQYSLTQWVWPTSRTQAREWLESHIRDRSSLSLGIALREEGKLIGEAGIARLDHINRSGEYYIFIGDRTHWGKGIGTEVTRLIVSYGFSALGLNRIMLTVSDLNVAGVKAYTRSGFKQEGLMREACYRDGKFHNKVLMSILRSEWES